MCRNLFTTFFLNLTKRKFIKKIAGNPRKLPTKHVRPSFFTQFVILSENYYDDQYENQSEGSFYADWELMEVASSPQGNHNETISLSSETDKSSSETCVVAKIMNSVWTHLTGLADEIERLEKELHWDNSNETINKQLNETDDYPDASNNSQELDLTEVKSSGASSINMSRPLEKVGILTPNSSSVDITANRTCNDGTCSNAMVIKNGEMKVNGTSVKQLANKMEIEKLEQWQNQIENCKQLLKLDPNITLEEITSKYRRKKYKDRAIPVDERSFYRRHSEAGKLHRPRHFRGKRQAHLAPSLQPETKLTRHRRYQRLSHLSPGKSHQHLNSNENSKIHNYIF